MNNTADPRPARIFFHDDPGILKTVVLSLDEKNVTTADGVYPQDNVAQILWDDDEPCHWSHAVNSTAGYCSTHGARWLQGESRCWGWKRDAAVPGYTSAAAQMLQSVTRGGTPIVEQTIPADYCYDVARVVCHECDEPYGGAQMQVVPVEYNDEDGAHPDALCYVHPWCVAVPEPVITQEDIDAVVAVAVVKAQTEIERDIAEGVVPADVASFSALHDFVDANEYGGITRDAPWVGPDGHLTDFLSDGGDFSRANLVQDAVDAWLKAGRPDFDPLDEWDIPVHTAQCIDGGQTGCIPSCFRGGTPPPCERVEGDGAAAHGGWCVIHSDGFVPMAPRCMSGDR